MQDSINVLYSDFNDYQLLDTGDRMKLEKFGDVTVVRSEPKAWWKPSNPEIWVNADARYIDEDKKNARWVFKKKVSSQVLKSGNLRFATKFMDGSKHLGVFPEQKPHWDYIAQTVKSFQNKQRLPKLLNLFGYTGAATLAAASAGCEVVHVDASKPSVDWARKNASLSKLDDAPIRWIIDDALKFAKREERRGSKYDAIVLDPPAFGRGPKGELWKLEKMLPELLDACSNILSSTPLCVIMTLYSIDASSIMAANMLHQYFGKNKGCSIEAGELALAPKSGGYSLPLSIWAKADFQK